MTNVLTGGAATAKTVMWAMFNMSRSRSGWWGVRWQKVRPKQEGLCLVGHWNLRFYPEWMESHWKVLGREVTWSGLCVECTLGGQRLKFFWRMDNASREKWNVFKKQNQEVFFFFFFSGSLFKLISICSAHTFYVHYMIVTGEWWKLL